MERTLADLVRYALAADLDLAALLLLAASLAADGRPELEREGEAPPIPEHHYPH